MTATTAGQLAGELTTALLEAASLQLRPHCGDPETHYLWLSEDHRERAIAVKLCIGCPVFDPCGQAAEARGERFGVWAGIDRTVKPGGKRPRPEGNDI
jgi:Transcription factor WhiB